MRVRNEEAYKSKKEIVMESCFNCFAENGLHGTGIAALSQYCHLSKTAFYIYFHDVDDLITQCTAYVESGYGFCKQSACKPAGSEEIL